MPPPGVKARVDRFWRAVKRLGELASTPKRDFVKNADKVDAAERNLQVAVEALIDVGEFIISRMGWETPRSYREVGEILKRHGVLDEELERKYGELVRLRNIVIHNYVYLTPEEVYEYAGKLRKTLTTLASKLLGYMADRGLDP